MTACKQWQGPLSDAAHGATPSDDSLQTDFLAHLSGCVGCQQELASQTAFLSSLELPLRPSAGELNGWRKIGPKIHPAARKRVVLGFPAAASLGLAILITGIGIGRLMIAQPAAPEQRPPALIASAPQPATVNESITPQDNYVEFLENAAPMLLAITNRNNPALVSVRFDGSGPREPQAAASLAADANALAGELESQKRDREAALVRELELVFLQIANLPNPPNASGLRLLQAAIEDRALLFQLSVEELRNLPQSRPNGA